MNGWKGAAGALSAVLVMGGCITPLSIDIGGDEEIRGSGHVVTEARSVSGFDAIEARGAATVVIRRTGRERVTITAEDNLQSHLDAYVRGGTLHVGTERGYNLRPRREILIEVETFEVAEVRASGAVDVDFEVGWVPQLWIDLSGASRLSAWGEADVQNAEVSGASNYDALDLETLEADVDASGASQVLVWVHEFLDATASGASQVRFAGDPVVRARVSGAATVTRY
jgi:hypothetical protein